MLLQTFLYIGIVFASKRNLLNLLSDKNTKNNHSKGNRMNFVPRYNSKLIFTATGRKLIQKQPFYSCMNSADLIWLRILAGGSGNINFLMKT